MRVGLAMVVAGLLTGPWAAAGGQVDYDLDLVPRRFASTRPLSAWPRLARGLGKVNGA